MTQPTKSVFARFRVALIRGALFILPIWLCVFVVGIVYNLCESWLGGLTAAVVSWLVPADWLPGFAANGHIPGLSMLVAFALLSVIGAVASWQIGRQGLRMFDLLFLAIPGVSTVYSAARKMIDAIGEPGQSRFKKVVLIDWPGPGIKTLGFVTNETETPDGVKQYFVFVPTMPNPTSGFVVVVPVSEAIETTMRPEEALKLCMSLGVLAPSVLPIKQ